MLILDTLYSVLLLQAVSAQHNRVERGRSPRAAEDFNYRQYASEIQKASPKSAELVEFTDYMEKVMYELSYLIEGLKTASSTELEGENIQVQMSPGMLETMHALTRLLPLQAESIKKELKKTGGPLNKEAVTHTIMIVGSALMHKEGLLEGGVLFLPKTAMKNALFILTPLHSLLGNANRKMLLQSYKAINDSIDYSNWATAFANAMGIEELHMVRDARKTVINQKGQMGKPVGMDRRRK